MAKKRAKSPPKIEFALKPYPLQQEILNHLDGKELDENGREYRFLIVSIGRQAGKSWLARYVSLNKAINEGKAVMWMSPFITNARTHWNLLLRLIEDSGIPYERVNRTEKEIYFYGGGSIIVRPAVTADNSRGLTLDIAILDEAAFFPDGNYVWYDVVQPMLTTTKGKALFLSTPHGMNWFYDQYMMGDNGVPYYKSWQADSYVNPYQDKELLDQLRKTIPERSFKEEYLAEFLASSGGVFNGVDNVLTEQGLPAPAPDGIYVMSADFGFADDGFTITIFDKVSRCQVAGWRYQHMPVEDMVQKIIDLCDEWQPERLMVERNGVGNVFLRILRKRLSVSEYDDNDFTYQNTKISALWVDNAMKRDMVESLVADIEFGNIALLNPANSIYMDYAKHQRGEISVYQRKQNALGTVKYEAPAGYHDDTVSALYLVNKALPKVEYIRRTTTAKVDKESPFRRNARLRRQRRKLGRRMR